MRRLLHLSPFARLHPVELVLMGLLALIVVGFGAITLERSAFSDRRKTDAGVYFRAAWAITADRDPYAIKDDNGWSYLYPPPLAIVAVPFAEGPMSRSAIGWIKNPEGWEGLPYAWSVAIWYAIGVLALVLGAHWMGCVIQHASQDAAVREMPRGCRRWWQDRLWPTLIGIVAVGSTLSRGQINTLMFLGIAGSVWWMVRGRGFGAGVWIASAAVLKLFPALLGLIALLRRDWKTVGGCFAGAAFFLAVMPASLLGPERMVELNKRFAEVMLLPHAGAMVDADGGEQGKKVDELQRTRDNQSLMSIYFAATNLERVRESEQIEPGLDARVFHVAGSVALLGLSIWAWWRLRRARSTWEIPLTVGLLSSVMLAISPVCHLHYFVLAIPLIAVLWGIGLDRSATRQPTLAMIGLFGVYFVLNLVPRLGDGGVPALAWLGATRYVGLAQYANLMLIGWGCWVAWSLSRAGAARVSGTD